MKIKRTFRGRRRERGPAFAQKLRRGRRERAEEGSILLVSILVSGILGITLGTYLIVARLQHVSSVYSQSWHKALTMAESGVEEALAKINGAGVSTFGTGGPGGASFELIHRDFGGGAYDVRVAAGPGSGSTIYSTGHVTIPVLSSTVSRAIVVTTTNSPLFTAAVAARTNLTMNASRTSGLTFADSFDSSNPHLGTYANGEVACLAGLLNLGSSKIAGDLLLGAAVTNTTGPVQGSVFRNFNMDLPDVAGPSPYWVPASFANQKIDGVTYRYAFHNSGDYLVNASGSIYVGPDAKVKLQVVSSGFNAPSIYVAGTNWHAGELVIYALSAGFSLGDAIVESGKPANLIYLGLPGNTSLTFNDNTNFTGTIYAPEADFTNNVRNRRRASFIGSCIAKSVHINGPAAFHFDEDLLRNSPVTRGFVITSWKEL